MYKVLFMGFLHSFKGFQIQIQGAFVQCYRVDPSFEFEVNLNVMGVFPFAKNTH